MSFAALAHIAEGLCLSISHAKSRKFSCLSCIHTNNISVHDGIAVYLSFKTLIRNKSLRLCRFEYSVIKCNRFKIISYPNYVIYQTEKPMTRMEKFNNSNQFVILTC